MLTPDKYLSIKEVYMVTASIHAAPLFSTTELCTILIFPLMYITNHN